MCLFSQIFAIFPQFFEIFFVYYDLGDGDGNYGDDEKEDAVDGQDQKSSEDNAHNSDISEPSDAKNTKLSDHSKFDKDSLHFDGNLFVLRSRKAHTSNLREPNIKLVNGFSPPLIRTTS